MSKTYNNINTINKKDLLFLHNRELRILKREEKIKYLESLYKPSLQIDFDFMKSLYKPNSLSQRKEKSFNLPKIQNFNKTMNSYERMKNYKVHIKKKKNKHNENKVKKFIAQSGFFYETNNKEKEGKEKNKNSEVNNKQDDKIQININDKEIEKIINKLNSDKKPNEIKPDTKCNFTEEKPNTNRSTLNTDDNINNNKMKKYKDSDFDYYLKMQTKAEIAMKPKLGDNSKDLINYIKAIQEIRNNLMENMLTEINDAENRFNTEKPENDSEFVIQNKSLNIHKWKNIFFLKDYQRFFLKGLKGKISNNNYYIMQKKFAEINNICFANTKGQPIKKIKMPE